jgi:hypothetical protein
MRIGALLQRLKIGELGLLVPEILIIVLLVLDATTLCGPATRLQKTN